MELQLNVAMTHIVDVSRTLKRQRWAGLIFKHLPKHSSWLRGTIGRHIS